MSCVALVYDCLDAALGKRRELSTARVAAMIKRLLSVSLQMTQVSVFFVFCFVRAGGRAGGSLAGGGTREEMHSPQILGAKA